VQAHGEVLQEHCRHINSAEIYRAAVRVVMRLVVILFAESRDLLPRDNALYHAAYGVGGLLEELEESPHAADTDSPVSSMRLAPTAGTVPTGPSGQPSPGTPSPRLRRRTLCTRRDRLGTGQALHVFESAAFDNSRPIFSDREVLRLLEKISRTRVRLRQGRQNTWVTVPVDFSDLSSEYIGILYEGLLDFELKTAPPGDPVIFLAVGNQPALPLSRLEAMDDRALAALLEKMQDTSSKDAGSEEESDDTEAAESSETDSTEQAEASSEDICRRRNHRPGHRGIAGRRSRHRPPTPHTHSSRSVGTLAAVAGGLVTRPRGTSNPAKQRDYEELLARKARQLVIRVVLPGEWFLVRWVAHAKGPAPSTPAPDWQSPQSSEHSVHWPTRRQPTQTALPTPPHPPATGSHDRRKKSSP
jgi:hypothetical protein